MNIKPIANHFLNYLPLDEAEIEKFAQRVTEKTVKRRQFILHPGDRCKCYTFVVSGCFKMYKEDEKGAAHNLQFAVENDWIADIGSFHSGKASELYIEALEKSVILQIQKADLLHLYTHFPKVDRYFRVIIEDAFIEQQNRVLQNISSTAEERYLWFLENKPALFNRISNVQIASYIGVSPEFLSKIRKNLAGK